MIFVTIEGTNEDMAHGNIRKERWVHRYEASRVASFLMPPFSFLIFLIILNPSVLSFCV